MVDPVIYIDPSRMCTRGHWRPSEDEKLKELVALYGPHNWNAIAEKLQGRSGAATSCIQYIYDPQDYIYMVNHITHTAIVGFGEPYIPYRPTS